MTDSKFYITTAIPYVNAKPHIGFALELIQADVIARARRQAGDQVWFVTGTDENALKNVQAAEKADQGVVEYVDGMSARFRELCQVLEISNDDFIRTTEARHVRGAQKLWSACRPQDIYKKTYSGLYCVGCEQYYAEDELMNGLCPEHKSRPEMVSEENYFFKLTNYQEQLEQLIETGEVKLVPESKKNEMLAFIKRGLEDFSISRTRTRAKNWGVPVPADEGQVMYVWFDALSNYLNALGYADNTQKYSDFWVNNSRRLHVIGKGITRFHCIYWPAMLLSAGIPLPTEIFIHGYVTVDGQKISKSLGNTVDPVELVDKYGVAPVRYYLLREISAYGDGDFSEEKFKQRYQSDLANGLGNTFSRVTNMIEKFGQGKFVQGESMNQYTRDATALIEGALQQFQFDVALFAIMGIVRAIDEEIEQTKPWAMAKSEKVSDIQPLLDKWGTMLLDVALYLRPFMPDTAETMEKSLRVEQITKVEPLFPRLS